MDVFVSVGTGLNPTQEAFVVAVEDRLRAEGLTPHTLERNEWSTLAPLDAVDEVMDRCQGAVILGLERYHFARGTERRGATREDPMKNVALATPWNQIEATLAYSKGLPLLMIVDETVKGDGLLEKSHDWSVAELPVDPGSLATNKFNGMLRDWRERVAAKAAAPAEAKPTTPASLEPAKLTMRELVGALRPVEFWTVLGVAVAVLVATFGLGAKFSWLVDKPAPAAASQAAPTAAPRP